MPVVVRRVRELLVAGTTLSIAAAAHLLGGGALPGAPLAWLVVLALSAPVAVWTARRRLTLRRLLPAMVALQLVQHSALSVLGAARADDDPWGTGSTVGAGGAVPALAGHAGHDLGPGSLVPATGTAVHLEHAADGGTTTWMLAAHAVAVLLTALLLAAGDRAAANVASHLAHVALLVRGPASLPVARRGPVVAGPVWRPLPWHARRRPAPRGPPVRRGALARAA
ncbi:MULTISPECIES: hypothetical protein [unclassified Isoptericola]|uniref:hypothetical protein n=1 Tax=unclassified Isoptericola TaxID=2623355 RepID=UPI00365A6813